MGGFPRRIEMADFVFSSESVGDGHPDKVADQVSDAILDALMAKDPMSRVACETFVTAHGVHIGGEISSTAEDIDYVRTARQVIKDIGYDNDDEGMWNGVAAPITLDLVEQSGDIWQGVGKTGAGDQGMMFGFAQAGGDMMPLPISLAHGLTRRMSETRRNGTLGWLRPDTKSQVSVRFEDDKPLAVEAVVLAAQHAPDVSQETIQAELREHVVNHVIPGEMLHDETKYFINHTGKFVKGGPAADTGLTGRKIIVDTYGGWIPHGGGAFSGKDCTKVDRSAAYYARYAAKNLVAAGLADELQIQVAYSIGSTQPVSINVDTFGTGDAKAAEAALRRDFSFAPGDLIEELGLRAPIYQQTAAYGHFGRPDIALPWEQLRN